MVGGSKVLKISLEMSAEIGKWQMNQKIWNLARSWWEVEKDIGNTSNILRSECGGGDNMKDTEDIWKDIEITLNIRQTS